MAQKPTPKSRPNKGESREDRLKAALKANLARRKSQAKARSHAPDDTGSEKE
ncbi:hypothetical protein [Thalassococcus sp. S3]|uniref:hypothetical protein n=1 Tax=Thalassococcus sp. S3 TaxID=2017482 RepID=UPI0013EE5397|nr:hypothetical protein [Thalassococcus sp. S3]